MYVYVLMLPLLFVSPSFLCTTCFVLGGRSDELFIVVATALIELPVNLEAAVIEDVSNLVNGLDLTVNIPGVGSLTDLLGNPLTDVTVTTSGESVSPCTCPEGATPICSNATCSCDCPDGFFYNPVTQSCVLAPSGLVRAKRRHSALDSRQAKRQTIEARLAKLAK